MKENPRTAYIFFFKQVQTCLQPLIQSNSPKFLLEVSFWHPRAQQGRTLYTRALKAADRVVPPITSSWLYQQLDMHSTLQSLMASFSQRFQLALLSWGAPHTAARCYRRRKRVRKRQHKVGRTDPALQVAPCSAKGSPLPLGCKLSCLWDFMSCCLSKQPGTVQPFFRGARLQELSSCRAAFIPPWSGIKQHILQSFYYFVC